jgi:hypothetical protein
VTDADGDLLLAAILEGPKRGRVAGLGTSYSYFRESDFFGKDSFTFKAWDGYAYSNVGKITISIERETVGGPVTLEILGLESGSSISLQIEAPGPGTVQIEESADLSDWRLVQTLPTTGEQQQVEIPIESDGTQQFYRASWERE